MGRYSGKGREGSGRADGRGRTDRRRQATTDPANIRVATVMEATGRTHACAYARAYDAKQAGRPSDRPALHDADAGPKATATDRPTDRPSAGKRTGTGTSALQVNSPTVMGRS